MSDPRSLGVEAALHVVVEWVKLGVELTGIVVVTVGVVHSIRRMLTRNESDFNAVRLTLAGYLAVALEFQLASDILGTALAPSWQGIGKLAAVASIRTGLNYFLIREMQHENREQADRGAAQQE